MLEIGLNPRSPFKTNKMFYLMKVFIASNLFTVPIRCIIKRTAHFAPEIYRRGPHNLFEKLMSKIIKNAQ